MDERTALFWDCRAEPDEALKGVLLRLHRHGCDFSPADTLTQLELDKKTGLFNPVRSSPLEDWRGAVEFAEHADGLALTLTKGKPMSIDLLKTPSGAVLLLHESAQEYFDQAAKPVRANLWLGLLMDLYEAAQASSCLFPVGLRGLPVSAWKTHVAAQRASAELLLTSEEPTPAAGQRIVRLAGGLMLRTSLPVKAAPHEE